MPSLHSVPSYLSRNLSEQAQKALAQSELFAQRYPGEATQVQPIHLLYALARQQGSLARTFLAAYSIAPRNILTLVKLQATDARERAEVAVSLSPNTKRVLRKARAIAKEHEQQFIGTEHLLFALLDPDVTPFPKEISVHIQRQIGGLLEQAVQLPIVMPQDAFRKRPSTPADAHTHAHEEVWEEEAPPAQHASPIESYCQDLTARTKESDEDTLFGRDKEIAHITRVLLRRTKNNPLLVGEAGVGKTAIAQGFAQRVAENKVPPALRGKRVFSLDLSSLIAGTMFRGEFESRIRDLIHDIKKHNAILFIDEIHNLAGAGAAQGSMDAANMLKPALTRGDLHCIGATTHEEYTKYIEKDAALARRFQYIAITEETPEESLGTLRHAKHLYEKHHRVLISDDALRAAVNLSSRYMPERALPDKAFDVLDEAASKLQQADNTTQDLAPEHIARVIAEATGIPMERVSQEERVRYLTIEKELASSVIGQEEAIAAVASTLKRKKAGIGEEGRPFGSFLFVGPSGVGKTELAKTLARVLRASEGKTPTNLISIDMSEYAEAHSIARLIGSPPGYVGYEEGGQLTDKVRRMPYSVVLFDEIEKAHPQILHILLQILEEGALTDGQGRRVSFAESVIVLTSNIGTELWSTHELGFTNTQQRVESVHAHVMQRVKETIRPEVINRLDHIVPFNPLAERDIRRVVHMQLDNLCRRLAGGSATGALSPAHTIDIAPGVATWVTKRAMREDRGARGVRSIIATHIEPSLAEHILRNNPRNIRVAVKQKVLVVR